MVRERSKVMINGLEYRVNVTERGNCRDVTVWCRMNGGMDYIEDKRYASSGGIFTSPKPLPSREDHVSDAITKAVSKFEQRKETEDEMRESLDRVLSSAKEVWEDE